MRYSLITALSAVVILTVSTVMLGHGYIVYLAEKERIVKDTALMVHETQQSTADAIISFIEAYAVNEYEKLLAVEMQHEGFAAIVVEDRNMGEVLGTGVSVTGKFRNQDGTVVAFDSTNSDHVQALEHCFYKVSEPLISATGDDLGSITICSSDLEIQKILQERVYDHISESVLISLLMIVLLFVFAHRFVLRPINQVQGALSNTDASGIPKEPIHIRSAREVQNLATSINRMLDVIRSSRIQLEQQHNELQKERDRFQLAVEGSEDGLWDWNLTTNEVYFAPQWKAMLGYRDDELKNDFQEWASRLHPEDHDLVMEAVDWHLKRLTDLYEVTFRMRCKDGSWKWITARGKAHFDEAGQPVRFVGFHTDITPQKEAEERIRAARDNAEQANRAKSQFLSSMSHELRTPLNSILGFSQILQMNDKEPLSAQQNNAVEQIMRGGEHLLTLIDEVLDLARIESGKIQLEMADVNPNDVCRQCIVLVNRQAFDADVQVKSHLQSKYGVNCDQTRLKQVLLNLLSNAIKYNSHPGEVMVTCEDADKDTVRISVRDTGVGIPHDLQSKVFSPFDRLGREASEIQGTGIGLNVAKDLIEAMGGSINFTSEEGEGSIFWINLPKSTAIEEKKSGVSAADQGKEFTITSDRHDQRLILYIEDNPSNIVLMENILEQVGHITCLSAHTAELGVSLARERQPDLIFMDINLPNMDGYQALEELKACDETKHIPVVALSARAMLEDLEQAETAEFIDYLTKPIDVRRVVEIVSALT